MNAIKLITLLGTLSLVACQSMGNKETQGTLIGGVVGGTAGGVIGGAAGGQVGEGIAIGALIGGAAGNAIGRTLDTSDNRESMRALRRASRAPVGDSVYWHNGRTGHWGYYCPIRDGHTRIYGDYCREFMTSVYMNGKMERMYGTACRRPNGTWYGI